MAGGFVKCRTCRHRATKTTPAPGQFLLYGCRKKRITFGMQSDWDAGKWLGSAEDKKKWKIKDMPEECDMYQKSNT
jgi:hypothetical protein